MDNPCLRLIFSFCLSQDFFNMMMMIHERRIAKNVQKTLEHREKKGWKMGTDHFLQFASSLSGVCQTLSRIITRELNKQAHTRVKVKATRIHQIFLTLHTCSVFRVSNGEVSWGFSRVYKSSICDYIRGELLSSKKLYEWLLRILGKGWMCCIHQIRSRSDIPFSSQLAPAHEQVCGVLKADKSTLKQDWRWRRREKIVQDVLFSNMLCWLHSSYFIYNLTSFWSIYENVLLFSIFFVYQFADVLSSPRHFFSAWRREIYEA